LIGTGVQANNSIFVTRFTGYRPRLQRAPAGKNQPETGSGTGMNHDGKTDVF